MTKTNKKKQDIKKKKEKLVKEKEEREIKELIKSKKKFIVFFLVFISIFCISLVTKALQNDTLYTIKIGKLILNNGIDMMDHFSWHNLSYTYPHWLYDVFIYLIYSIDGFKSIYISTIIIYIILIASIFIVNIKINKNYTSSAVSAIVCSLALGGFATARAQLVSYIIFIWEVYYIESLLETGKKKYIVLLLLSSLLICNLHLAVWPFYFILFLPYIAEYITYKIFKKLKKDNKLSRYLENKFTISRTSNIKYLVLTMVISTLTGLLTPLGDTPYTYIYKTMIGNSQKYISEHMALTWVESPFVIIIAVETILLGILSKFKVSDVYMLSGLTLMAITSNRHLSFLALIGTLCLARVFTYFFERATLNIDNKVIKFTTKYSFMIPAIVLISILSITIYSKANKNRDYLSKEFYPIEAVEYIKDNLDVDNIRLFNDYNFGSYLLFNDIKVFIDSRADLYTKPFSHLEYDIFDDYMYSPGNYHEKFEFYGITHVLIYKVSALNDVLKNDDNYTVLYEDDNFVLYEKNA